MKIGYIKNNEINSIKKFQQDGWEDIEQHYRFYVNSLFCHPLKLIKNGEIVAIGSVIIHEDVAWLAHIITLFDHREKGFGALITKKLIEISKENNCSTIYLIATDLGKKLYEKLGFMEETKYIFFKKKDFKGQFKISKSIIHYEQQFKNQIFDLDHEISSENREKYLEMFLEDCFVFFEKNLIEGFYTPSFGEGLILANTPSIGNELLKIHLNNNDKVVLPENNIFSIKFLKNNGFYQNLTATRMRLGLKRPVQYEKIFNRIGGNLG
ncbi:MAG: GNAT family N-acetyltransferase [Methanobacteriaceae archaeon]|jgi:GNAT superfamily N-acetyltransferase|nr:GNAT family N-acetyltransferase [Candidatus Methanorudis spinitermitis]